MHLAFLMTLSTLGAIFKGYIFTHLWRWFLVPNFNFPQISTVQAVGVALILSHLLSHRDGKDRSKTSTVEDFIEVVAYSFILPLYYLLIGWIFSHYM